MCMSYSVQQAVCKASLSPSFFCTAGLAGAWIGLTVQHCGNHGAMSTSPAVNKAMGLTDDLIGGSSLMWRYHHQVSACSCLVLFVHCPWLSAHSNQLRLGFCRNISTHLLLVSGNQRAAALTLFMEPEFSVIAMADVAHGFLQVSHHIHCNDLELDEDVFSAFPFLRFDARMPRKWFHKYQHLYMV